MTTRTYDKLIRNLAVAMLTANLLYFLTPFLPPIIWRMSFVLLASYVVVVKMHRTMAVEKAVLLFTSLNLFHYFISYLWITPATSLLGNILVAMMAMPLFTYLGEQRVITQRFLNVSIVVLTIAAIFNFYHARNIAYAQGSMDELYEFVNNATSSFLMILPLLLLTRNQVIRIAGLFTCMFFLLMGAKRGNIVAAAIPTLAILYDFFKDSKRSLWKIVVSFGLIVVFVYKTYSWVVTNDFLMNRIDQTMEGRSSGRDVIYVDAWTTWYNSPNIVNILFGYGFDGTVNNLATLHYAHNDWLEVLVDYGIVGVLMYLAIFWLLYIQIRKEKRLDLKLVLIGATGIWFMKTLYSMGFSEENLAILMIALGAVLGQRKSESFKQKR